MMQNYSVEGTVHSLLGSLAIMFFLFGFSIKFNARGEERIGDCELDI